MTRRGISITLLGIGLLAAYTAFAWFLLLPGGHRLRSWFQDQEKQAAADHAAHRAARLSVFAAESAPPASGSVLFLGSSTIEFWSLGTSFPGRPCLNRGIGAETVAEMRSRLDSSLPGGPVLGTVLYAGSRELRTSPRTGSDVAREVLALAEEILTATGGAPLLVLGILPDRDQSPALRIRLEDLNSILGRECELRGLWFLESDRPPLRDPSGRLSRAHSRDAFHLNEAGYAVLSEWLVAEGGPLGALLR